MTEQSWKALLTPAIQDFIQQHADDDPKQLALQKWPDDTWPRALILDQIKARQKAKHKLSSWHGCADIIFPPSDLVEQASSEATARFKASLVSGNTCIDLTAGCGVDSWAFAQQFQTLHCVEQNGEAAAIIAHNLSKLCPKTDLHIHPVQAENFLKTAPTADLIYIDPQRRDTNKRGLFKFEDCSPNIFNTIDLMLQYTTKILIKASPMVSIEGTINTLPHIKNIYVVEWDGQCKEVLFLLEKNYTNKPEKYAITLQNNGKIHNKLASNPTENKIVQYNDPLSFLYEPSPAYQKADLMEEIAQTFGLKQLAPHTHLFTSERPIANFPGRSFRVTATLPVQKKALTINKANLTVRNFPDSVENLRKKLKLKDGGDTYIYACTLKSGEKKLILCCKDPVNFPPLQS